MRTTLARSVERRGVGLHTGAPVTVRLCPAPARTGRVFVRLDRHGCPSVRARLATVRDASRSVKIVSGEADVSTIEHLMAAVVACSIDDVRIELNGPEIPAMDGSSAPWLEALDEAGRWVHSAACRRQGIRICRKFAFQRGQRRAEWWPDEGFHLDVRVNFESFGGRADGWRGALTETSFRRDLASARTFGFEQELSALRARGLIRGASVHNAVLLNSDGEPVPPTELRFKDELVRHKALDTVGDIGLLGVPVVGALKVEFGGHAFHVEMLRALIRTQDAWRWTSVRSSPDT